MAFPFPFAWVGKTLKSSIQRVDHNGFQVRKRSLFLKQCAIVHVSPSLQCSWIFVFYEEDSFFTPSLGKLKSPTTSSACLTFPSTRGMLRRDYGDEAHLVRRLNRLIAST